MTNATLVRLDPINYENLDGVLVKLCQGFGSVQTYQEQFERLAN